MHRRFVRTIFVVLAAGALLASAGAVSVSAADYPRQVKQSFQKSCVKAAKSGGVSGAKAEAYCRAALNCLQDKLTLKQFKRLTENGEFASNKKVKACIKKASAKLE